MSLNPYNIDELKKSFDYLVQRNCEVQEDIRTALNLKDYWEVVKYINKFIKEVDEYKNYALYTAQEYRKMANLENQNISFNAKKTIKIKTSYLGVENNMLKKYIKECKSKIILLLIKTSFQNIFGKLVTSE
jgi:hypothetical protein